MPHEVRLSVFEGPIDLLLHLITRQRVDIYDVSLATITEEYLAAIRARDGLDLESATGFLVVAATLLELKSARLLPAHRGEEEAEARLLEERDLLLGRLVECATYREAGAWLGAGLLAGERYFARTAALEPQFVDAAPDLLARVGLDDLAGAAARLLAPKPQEELDTSHIAPITVSVRDAVADMAATLRDEGSASFDVLCGRTGERIEVVVRFLALLELFKFGAVELDQAHSFGDIVARWTGEVGVQDAVQDADEYTIAEGAS